MQQKVLPSTTELPDGDPWSRWVNAPSGRYVLQWEQSQFDLSVTDLFGFHAIQLGTAELHALRFNRMASRVLACRPGDRLEAPILTSPSPLSGVLDQGVATPADHPDNRTRMLLASFEELPFADSSVDLLVLPHVLERSIDPHQVLREVFRVLRPEGRVIVTGFNPISLWGARELIMAPFTSLFQPAQRHLISMPRLRDWLRLLSFEPERARYGCYRPPLRTQVGLDRTAFFERFGDRWWPICGAVYLLSAVKRVRAMRLVGPAWKSDSHRAGPVAVVGAPRFESPGADAVMSPDKDSRESGAAGRSSRQLEQA